MRHWPLVAGLMLALSSASALGGGESPPPTIAIIIDDMGNNVVQGRRLIEMDHPLTLAFLPYRRHTRSLAESAHAHSKEIMLHAPMANTRRLALGPGGLEADMSEHGITSTLRRALHAIPHVKGVNNHMGSLLTQRPDAMRWIMTELDRYPLYFVDSRTIATTVAADAARDQRVPHMSRDVFLDHETTTDYLDRQFRKLIDTARRKGTAIAIGHPHKVTVDYLKEHLPELDEKGIAVATVSSLWAMRHDNQRMFVDGEKQPVSPALAKKDE